MVSKTLKYTFIVGEEEARKGAVLPFLGVPGMVVNVPAGACNGQRVILSGNGKSYTVKLQICDATYKLHQQILGGYLHDSLLLEHRDRKHMGCGTTGLLALLLGGAACTIGVDMLYLGYPMMALALILPYVWVKIKTNKAKANVELKDRAQERQELLENP